MTEKEQEQITNEQRYANSRFYTVESFALDEYGNNVTAYAGFYYYGSGYWGMCKVCGAQLKNAHYVKNKKTGETAEIGSECANRLLGENKAKSIKRGVERADRQFKNYLKLKYLVRDYQQFFNDNPHLLTTVTGWYRSRWIRNTGKCPYDIDPVQEFAREHAGCSDFMHSAANYPTDNKLMAVEKYGCKACKTKFNGKKYSTGKEDIHKSCNKVEAFEVPDQVRQERLDWYKHITGYDLFSEHKHDLKKDHQNWYNLIIHIDDPKDAKQCHKSCDNPDACLELEPEGRETSGQDILNMLYKAFERNHKDISYIFNEIEFFNTHQMRSKYVENNDRYNHTEYEGGYPQQIPKYSKLNLKKHELTEEERQLKEDMINEELNKYIE